MAGKFDASMTCANTSGTTVVDCGLREQLPESLLLTGLGLRTATFIKDPSCAINAGNA